MSLAPERRLDCLPWPEIAQLARQPGSTVLWPLGATEQHGPHLPLGTDAVFADRVADAVLARLDRELPIVRLPLQSLGFSPEHRGFPGTISLPAQLLLGLVEAVGRDLQAAGFQRLVLLNAHGGQIALLATAARQLHGACPDLAVLPCFLWRGPEGLKSLIAEPERSQGLHAGLAETSLMMHLAPEWTREVREPDGLGVEAAAPPGWSLEGAAPCAWLTDEISRSGVIGDPRGASESLGADLFECLVAGWVRRLDGLLRSDWPPKAAR